MPLSKSIKTSHTVVKEIEIEVLNHKDITYKNKKYVVCYVPFNDDDKLFVIDEYRKKDIIDKKWAFKKESGYISKSNTNKDKRSELYLHNFLMDKTENDDQIFYIDHINDYGCDNRLENLQILNKIEYNNNIKRKYDLPSDCEINIDDIPKFITYRKANSSHGDMFVIDIKLVSSYLKWHSTSSKSMDTKTKLKQAIDQLHEFYKTNIELRELNKKINNIKKCNELIKSYNEILLLSEYPIEVINKNLITLKKELKIYEEFKIDEKLINNPKIEIKPEYNIKQDYKLESEINDTLYLNEIKPIIKKEIEPLKIIENKIKLIHKDVNYKNKKYTVGYCSNADKDNILFIVDFDKKESVISKKWYYNKETKYIFSTHIDIDGSKKYLYQHIYMVNGLVFNQESNLSIDHINQIGKDNRNENLRELTQSHQNINRGKFIRTTELPEGCGINLQDIPTNIYYRKAHGLHGDRFYVEIKYTDPPFLKDSSSSKLIDLKTKLQQAILILEEYKKKNPDYAQLVDGIKNKDTRNNLRKSFNEILQLSKFPQEIIDKNLVEIEEEVVGEEKIDEDAKDLAQQLVEQGFKGVVSNLPQDCGVTPNMIPKYCYYKPASDKRGDKFIIERHPKLLSKGLRQWATTESRTKTTKQKFDLMILKLIELDN